MTEKTAAPQIRRGNIVRLKKGIAPGRRATAEVIVIVKETGAVTLSRKLAGFQYWNATNLEFVADGWRQ